MIFLIYFVIKKIEKGGFYSTDPAEADVARKLTWHAGPVRGCDAALRPRGRAARGPREARVARARGKRPRDPRGCPCGAPRGRGGWFVKGPRVSGPL